MTVPGYVLADGVVASYMRKDKLPGLVGCELARMAAHQAYCGHSDSYDTGVDAESLEYAGFQMVTSSAS